MSNVIKTCYDAVSSKWSAAHKLYFDYPELEHMIAPEQKVIRQPLINRGYFSRVHAVRSTIGYFFDTIGARTDQQNFQVVNIGCGLDPLYFWIYSDFHDCLNDSHTKDFRYFELDFKSVLKEKAQLIRQIPELRVRSGSDGEGGLIGTDKYVMVPINLLTDLDSFSSLLCANGFDPKLPTCFVSECVCSYLPAEIADRILGICCGMCSQFMFCAYEIFNTKDRFGRVMQGNLGRKGCPILSTSRFETVDAIQKHVSQLLKASLGTSEEGHYLHRSGSSANETSGTASTDVPAESPKMDGGCSQDAQPEGLMPSTSPKTLAAPSGLHIPTAGSPVIQFHRDENLFPAGADGAAAGGAAAEGAAAEGAAGEGAPESASIVSLAITDMHRFYTYHIPVIEKFRIEQLELFDEVEEWRLIQEHYYFMVCTNIREMNAEWLSGLFAIKGQTRPRFDMKERALESRDSALTATAEKLHYATTPNFRFSSTSSNDEYYDDESSLKLLKEKGIQTWIRSVPHSARKGGAARYFSAPTLASLKGGRSATPFHPSFFEQSPINSFHARSANFTSHSTIPEEECISAATDAGPLPARDGGGGAADPLTHIGDYLRNQN